MHIEFKTTDKVALDYFYPLPSSKVLPEWYKKMPKYHYQYDEMTSDIASNFGNKTPQTIKGCIPVRDFLTSGYVIRCHADITITPKKHNGFSGWSSSSSEDMCNMHEHRQCPVQINNKAHHYIKIKNVWKIKTPIGHSCYFYQPDFFGSHKIKLFPSVVDTDLYNDEVLFSGIVLGDESFTINAGDPLMVVFPFKRNDWEHSIGFEQQEHKSVISRIMEKAYLNLFHSPKKYR